MEHEVRSRGLMAALELVDSDRNCLAASVHRALLDCRIITTRRAGYNVIRIDPALTVRTEDIDFFLETLKLILDKFSLEQPL